MSVDPNPWNREYSDLEKKTAAVLWPQYKKPSERDTGPLIYGNPQNIRNQVDEAIEKNNREAGKLALLKRAIYRETARNLERGSS